MYPDRPQFMQTCIPLIPSQQLSKYCISKNIEASQQNYQILLLNHIYNNKMQRRCTFFVDCRFFQRLFLAGCLIFIGKGKLLYLILSNTKMRKSVQQTPAKKPPMPNQKSAEPPTPKKFDAKDYQSSGLSLEEITQFKNAFDTFDAQGKGLIDISEMKEAFIKLGFQNQSTFVIRLLDYLDKKNGGTINFGEFLKIATYKIDENSSREDCNTAFTSLDVTHSKKFSQMDLKDVIRDLGENYEPDEIEHMVRKADFDEDGYVNEDDFYNIVSRRVYDEPQQNDTKASQKAMSTAGKRSSRF